MQRERALIDRGNCAGLSDAGMLALRHAMTDFGEIPRQAGATPRLATSRKGSAKAVRHPSF